MYNIGLLTIILVASLSPAGSTRAGANLNSARASVNLTREGANLNYAAPFNPSGDYHPANPAQHESEKFTHFDLEVRRRKGKLVAWGDVRNVGAHYKFAVVSITEKTLKFTTVSVRGVRYGFDGRFLGSEDFASQFTGQGIVMLEGTLTRFEHGRKAAEITSPFLYYPGC